MISMVAKFGIIYNTLVVQATEENIEGFFKNIFAFTNYLNSKLLALYSQIMSALCDIAVDNITSQIGEYKDIFVGLGESLAVLFLLVEMFSVMVGFRFDRMEDAVSLGLKFVACKVVIENTDPIAQTIYAVFFSDGFKKVKDIAVKYYTTTQNMMSFSGSTTSDGGILGIGYLVMAIINLIVIFILGAFIFKIIAHLAGIVFELGIHQVMAPIALSTLCNSNARSTGIAWIKSYAAVCLQATIMTICFKINFYIIDKLNDPFNSVFSDIKTRVSEEMLGVAFNCIIPIFGMMLLTAALEKSGDITKRMLGA